VHADVQCSTPYVQPSADLGQIVIEPPSQPSELASPLVGRRPIAWAAGNWHAASEEWGLVTAAIQRCWVYHSQLQQLMKLAELSPTPYDYEPTTVKALLPVTGHFAPWRIQRFLLIQLNPSTRRRRPTYRANKRRCHNIDCVTLYTLGGGVCRWQRAELWLVEEHNQQCITGTDRSTMNKMRTILSVL